MAKTAMQIEAWAIERLIPYDKNAKKHDATQVNGIAQSLKLGWDQPIVVDAHGVIIKGHGRRLAALQLGLKEVPVLVRRDLSPEQVRAARLADNRAALGDLDMNLFRDELKDLDLGLLEGIFDEKELNFSTDDLGSMAEGVFVEDLDKAVSEQAADTAGKITDMKAVRVPLRKAFGFNDIAGADEIYVNRFMAMVAHQSGLTGADAFVKFVRDLVGEVAA